MALHIPKLREGSYFPSLLEPRQRAANRLSSAAGGAAANRCLAGRPAARGCRSAWAPVRLLLAFLRSLTARGLSGVELVTSDAHQGLKNAIAAVFAGASWQRCRTHFMANLLIRVPKRAQPGVATMVRTIYQQLSPAEVHAQLY